MITVDFVLATCQQAQDGPWRGRVLSLVRTWRSAGQRPPVHYVWQEK
jgi:hypothetical protein